MLLFDDSRYLVEPPSSDGSFLNEKCYFLRTLKEKRYMSFRRYSFYKKKETCFG
jgi:hypothetical protein